MDIFWATDGSPTSEAALPFLRGPLNKRGNRITVVTAVPSPVFSEARPDPAMLLWNLIPDYRERVSRAATELVVREVEALGGSKAEVSSEILLGSPPVALLNKLNEAAPDLLVMGAHGHSGVRDVLVGSVTRQVAVHAPCSALVVRARRRPKTVLLAYDGSADADTAIEFLAGMSASGMTATVLTVVERTVAPPEAANAGITVEELHGMARASARALAASAARKLRNAGWSVTTRTRDGERADEILHAAAATGADLVALGARGVRSARFSPTHRASGLAQEVMDHCGTAVLLARAR